MTYNEFVSTTWREYVHKVRGYNRRRSFEFEHTRAICYHIVAVNRDPKKAFPKMEKWWPLPTDDENVPDEDAEYRRLRNKLDQFKKAKK